MYVSVYCTAQTDRSEDGCYREPGHGGQHRGLDEKKMYEVFYWGEEAPAPVAPTLTEEELAILLVSLGPVKQFFPELVEKLERVRQAQQ